MQLAYAIGVAEPVSVMANTFGTGIVPEEKITALIRAHFPLTPRGIIDHLKLRRPIYRNTAAFGHFGRTEESFSWEATDKDDELRQEAPVAEAAVRIGMPRSRCHESYHRTRGCCQFYKDIHAY